MQKGVYRRFETVTLFAIAMAFLEALFVVYLRNISHPIGSSDLDKSESLILVIRSFSSSYKKYGALTSGCHAVTHEERMSTALRCSSQVGHVLVSLTNHWYAYTSMPCDFAISL